MTNLPKLDKCNVTIKVRHPTKSASSTINSEKLQVMRADRIFCTRYYKSPAKWPFLSTVCVASDCLLFSATSLWIWALGSPGATYERVGTNPEKYSSAPDDRCFAYDPFCSKAGGILLAVSVMLYGQGAVPDAATDPNLKSCLILASRVDFDGAISCCLYRLFHR